MSTQSGSRVLVLGGIRSGKSALAEALVAEGPSVRYVATAVELDGDAEWSARLAAHRLRRPDTWATEEVGADPARLVTMLAEAKPDEALLVDDLGGWVAGVIGSGTTGAGTSTDVATLVEALAAAVRDCAAGRLVLVSPEVGLSVVPATEVGRLFADALGSLNQAVAAACDAVTLVVAGQPSWLKGGHPSGPPVPVPAGTTRTTTIAVPAPVAAAAAVAAPLADGTEPSPFDSGLDLPVPDDNAGASARARLHLLDIPGAGFGGLAALVEFAGATQGTDSPRPWQSVRLLLVHADHEGGVAAGDSAGESARRTAQVLAAEGPLALLAGAGGVTVDAVSWAKPAAAIEDGDAMDAEDVESALAYGWRLATAAVDAGTDAIILGADGAGAEPAAVAVIARSTSEEPAGLLARVPAPGGRFDDAAWMVRCVALRDALHRTRDRPRQPRDLLAAVGGPDLAIATGAVLGAASRRTPVIIDGPVGIAAGMLARDITWQARHWLLLPDAGGHPAMRHGAEMLGITALVDLRLGYGEGAGALAVLPLLRGALTVAATTAVLSPPPSAATEG